MKPLTALVLLLALVPRGLANDYLAGACRPRAIPEPRNAWVITPPSGRQFCTETRIVPVALTDPATGKLFLVSEPRWISLGVIEREG